MTAKTCPQCQVSRPLDAYLPCQKSADGRQQLCKTCILAPASKLYQKFLMAEKKSRERSVKRRQTLLEQKAAKERNKTKRAEWRRANRDLVNASQNRQYRTNPAFAMLHRVRSRIYKALRGTQQAAPVNELLDCSAKELHAHLESRFLPGMTWENRHLWQIDYIQPLSEFDLTDPAQQRQCFRFDNLRPAFSRTQGDQP